MQFGEIALTDAIGAVLAHSLALPGGTLKKGRVLTREDLERLATAGLTHIIAARFAPDDVAEDTAAQRIAAAVTGRNAHAALPFTGRANLYAECSGLVSFDAGAVRALNLIDERVTIATLPPYEPVEAGQIIATVKIIPFSVPETVIANAERAGAAARIGIAPFIRKQTHLILTHFAATKGSVLEKRARVIADRLSAAGNALAATTTVDHEVSAVGKSIAAARAAGANLILIFAASAIVDRDDVVPSAVIAAGGRIERLGMPVDPGNLSLIAELEGHPVIGIPSCAGSPKLNGFDWILQRLTADVAVTSADVAAMGVGGLLKEIPSRPQPRERADAAKLTISGRKVPRIAALVLAAGRASRMGENKLVAKVGGVPILRRTVENVCAAGIEEVCVVTGHEAPRIETSLSGLDVRFVFNPDYAQGISTSLRAGLAALPATCDGALIVLGDMPEVTSTLIARMLAGFAPHDGRSIVIPVRQGKRGNPVLWARKHFAEMMQSAGDSGAKHLLGQHSDEVVEIEASDDAVLTDIDTPQSLAALRKRFSME